MTDKTLTLLLLAAAGLATGAAMASQAGINAELRRGLGHPLLAALCSFAIGTACLSLAAWQARDGFAGPNALAGIPWWGWLGGVLGAAIVTTSLMLAPRLGALALVATLTCGQLLASMLLDHYGWLGYSRQPVSAERIIGGLLVFAGVLLALRR